MFHKARVCLVLFDLFFQSEKEARYYFFSPAPVGVVGNIVVRVVVKFRSEDRQVCPILFFNLC